MKKTALILGFAALIFACKKSKTAGEFKATDLTGSTTLKGNIMKTQASGSNAPAVGVNITVKINNTDLYPNSPTASGSKTYSGTTDASGNYSISVITVGGTGAPALITINDITSTYDPTTGSQAIFTGTVTTKQLIAGVTQNFNYTMVNSVNIGTVATGTATVMGYLRYKYFKETSVGVYSLITDSLANHTVFLDFDKDPTTQQKKTYTATTDANGAFTFNIATTAAAGFANTAALYVIDFPTTQDTLKIGGTTVTGKPGYYNGTQATPVNLSGLAPTEIRNQVIVDYGAFTPN